MLEGKNLCHAPNIADNSKFDQSVYAKLESVYAKLECLRNSSPARAEVTITIGKATGATIERLLGVNIGPAPAGRDPNNADLTSAYQQIGVNLVRTHDFYGPLDMAVMYADRTRDPSEARSYDFKQSDAMWRAIVNGGFEPYFLGWAIRGTMPNRQQTCRVTVQPALSLRAISAKQSPTLPTADRNAEIASSQKTLLAMTPERLPCRNALTGCALR